MRKFLLAALALLLLVPAALVSCKKAETKDVYLRRFEAGGLVYGVTNEEEKICAVVGPAEDEEKEIGIPTEAEGYRVASVAPAAFFGQENLTRVTFPATLRTVGDNAFCNCALLEEVDLPEGLELLGWNAFYGCERLRRVSIPSTLTAVERNAFYDCSHLARVEIRDVGKWSRIAFEPFYDTFSSNPMWYGAELWYNGAPLTEAVIPEGTEGIADSAFYRCASLRSVTLPESLKKIGKYAFAKCTSLQAVTLPDSVSEIGERAFFSCSSLETATLGTGLQTLSPFAFSECETLKRIAVPANVQTIGSFCFASCFALEGAELPAGLVKIEMGAFRVCRSLREIRYGGTVDQWRAVDKVVFDPNSIYSDLDWNYGWNDSTDTFNVICADGVTK